MITEVPEEGTIVPCPDRMTTERTKGGVVERFEEVRIPKFTVYIRLLKVLKIGLRIVEVVQDVSIRITECRDEPIGFFLWAK